MLLAFFYVFLALLNFVFYTVIAFSFMGPLTFIFLALGMATVSTIISCFHKRIRELPHA